MPISVKFRIDTSLAKDRKKEKPVRKTIKERIGTTILRAIFDSHLELYDIALTKSASIG